MKVFVMGMHRSGTSLVTGLLYKCGLFLGDNLLMGEPDNPKGHYEDRTFIDINKQLLIRSGGRWRNPPQELAYRGMEPVMRAFLETWPTDRMVGWKDPRICFTFSLWYRLIHPEPVKVVLVTRPISEIARSLNARNQLPFESGVALAKRYREAALRSITHQRGAEHHETHFHAYFADWEAELKGVLDFIGLPMLADKAQLRRFITPSLSKNRE